MLDRFGNKIRIGWSQVEMIWLSAALSLTSHKERHAAYRDIASMVGRSYETVRARAYILSIQQTSDSIDAATKRIMVPGTAHGDLGPWRRLKPITPPSELKKPSPERLRAGR